MTQLGTKKSRRGCSHCKRRRVKCDERVPCSNCSRRGETCSLLYPPSPDTNGNGASSLDSADWTQDLELMHHYSRRTCYTSLGGGPETQNVWGEFVPKEAVKHRFLMHGILAIASLHIAWATKSDVVREKYLQICDKHQATALDSSRAIMANINEDVSAALFAFSSITSLSALAKSVIKASNLEEPRYVSINEMTECLVLTRGIREIVAASVHTLLRSPMSALLTGYEVHCNVRVLLPKRIVDKITLLQRMLADHCDNKQHHAFCSNAVGCLQQVYRNVFYFMSKDCLGVGHIWRWTAMVDTEFIRLLQAHYQPALIITSFFAFCCQFVRGEWFMGEWGRYTFEAMSAAVAPEFQHYLDWPREQFATDCADFRCGDATIQQYDRPPNETNEALVYKILFNPDPMAGSASASISASTTADHTLVYEQPASASTVAPTPLSSIFEPLD